MTTTKIMKRIKIYKYIEGENKIKYLNYIVGFFTNM